MTASEQITNRKFSLLQLADALLRTSLVLHRSAEWWLPVAEVEGTRETLARVRVCWASVPPPRVGQPTPDLSKPLP